MHWSPCLVVAVRQRSGYKMVVIIAIHVYHIPLQRKEMYFHQDLTTWKNESFGTGGKLVVEVVSCLDDGTCH